MAGELVPFLFGNLPEWAAVGIGGYGLKRGIERAEDFEALLLKDTGKTAQVLMTIMENHDLFSEIVERGMQAASRTASLSKRQLLARVVSRALDGTGMATPNDHLLLVKTVDAIEPPHVQMLVLISTPRPGQTRWVRTLIEGALTEEDVVALWPEVRVTFRPIMAVLVREGLVEDVGAHITGGLNTPAYRPTAYGRRFLEFLSRDDLGALRLKDAVLTTRYAEEGSRLDGRHGPGIVIRNLGPSVATGVFARAASNSHGQNPIVNDLRDTFDLEPATEFTYDAHPPTMTIGPPHTITVTWTDGSGLHEEVMVVARREQEFQQ
jgi:hypothetical protein